MRAVLPRKLACTAVAAFVVTSGTTISPSCSRSLSCSRSSASGLAVVLARDFCSSCRRISRRVCSSRK
eukprot:4618326-Prymnesium_polylepis.1